MRLNCETSRTNHANPLKPASHNKPGDQRAKPHVLDEHLHVRDEVVNQARTRAPAAAAGALRIMKPCMTLKRRIVLRDAGKPAGADDLRRRGAEQSDHQHQAGGQEHEKREHPVAPEAARLLHAPGVIHGRADRAEHTERAPDQQDSAADAEPDRSSAGTRRAA